MFGQELAVAAGCGLEQLAQFRGTADLTIVERVDDDAFRAIGQPDEKMAGEGEPGHVPALSPRGMDVEDPERHRQTFAAIDHPHQIGVLQVVIGQRVAGIAVFQQDDLVERAGASAEVAGSVGMIADIAGDQPQMIAIMPEIDTWTFERGECQRRLGDRQNPPT